MMDKLKLLIKRLNLKNRQRGLDKRFAEDGLTEEIILEQANINRERNEFDIPDHDEFIHEEYVQ